MLKEGAESVALDVPKETTRNQIASKVSRISTELDLRVSLRNTKDGGYALEVNDGPPRAKRKS
jgi:hypothetical protein